MELGIVDLGRTGVSIVRTLMAAGYRCVVWDPRPRRVAELAAEKAHGAASLQDLANELDGPRSIWLTGATSTIDQTIADLLPRLEADDVIVDCTDAHFADGVRRAAELARLHIGYVDVGISGGAAYPEYGRCLTVGGDADAIRIVAPILATLAADARCVHCGPAGAGHYVNMIHQGIERSLLAIYSEAFGILRAAEIGGTELNLAQIADGWQHGSLVASPLLDLTARALADDAVLTVAPASRRNMHDQWSAIRTAVEQDVPVPVLASAIYSAGERGEFVNRLAAAVQRARTRPRLPEVHS
jgi:6-phosphogluconate dehydrogenase